MKDLDEELGLKIKTVFEDFDDNGSEIGWEMLREKFPEKKSTRLPLWWLSGVAACLLLAFGLWYGYDSTPSEKTTVKTTIKQGQSAPQSPNESVSSASTSKQQHEPSASPMLNSSTNTAKMMTKKSKPNTSIPHLDHQQLKLNPAQNTNPLSQMNVVAQQNVAPINPQQVKKPDSVIVQQKETVIAKQETLTTKKTTAEFLKEQSQMALNKPKEKEKSEAKKNSLEVFAGTFMNYDGTNQGKMNAGFGMNANFQVAKNITLSVGAGISKNKLNYDSEFWNNRAGSGSGMSADMTPSSPSATAYATALAPDYLKNSTFTQIQSNISAMLLNIDLPITVRFYPDKQQRFYIATGISSNSYLSQKYNYSYTYTNSAINNGLPSSVDRSEENRQLNGFNFANSAIFAIGINQKIGKSNHLIFEPYFKPAIGYMGDKNLKINTAGVNLKFNFTKPTAKP